MYDDVEYARDSFDSYVDGYNKADDGGPVDYEADRIMPHGMHEYYNAKYATNNASSTGVNSRGNDRISKLHYVKIALLVPFVMATMGMTLFMGFLLFAHIIVNVGYWGNGHMPPNHFIPISFFGMVSFIIATVAAFRSMAMQRTGWGNRLCILQALFFMTVALPLLNN